MQQEKTDQTREKEAHIRELAEKLAPKPFDRSQRESYGKEAIIDPWTLRRIHRLEAQNERLQMRMARLEQQEPASVTPRFPHQGPPPNEDERREFERRTGYNFSKSPFPLAGLRHG